MEVPHVRSTVNSNQCKHSRSKNTCYYEKQHIHQTPHVWADVRTHSRRADRCLAVSVHSGCCFCPTQSTTLHATHLFSSAAITRMNWCTCVRLGWLSMTAAPTQRQIFSASASRPLLKHTCIHKQRICVLSTLRGSIRLADVTDQSVEKGYLIRGAPRPVSSYGLHYDISICTYITT